MANIMDDVVRYSKALKAMGRSKEAAEMRERVFASGSPEEAEKIMKEYFVFEKGKEFIKTAGDATTAPEYYSGDSAEEEAQEGECKGKDCWDDELVAYGYCEHCLGVEKGLYVCEHCGDLTDDDLARLCEDCYDAEYGDKEDEDDE